MEDCLERMDESPLGSGALAATTYPVDRYSTAELLGFAQAHGQLAWTACPTGTLPWSLRPHCSILMMHLSRFSEELILWCSWEFKFIELDDAYATGSSIMPQKKNPDVAELVRGKTGRVYGSLITLLTAMKGLPLAYNKDMQEDKEPVFDAIDTVELCLPVFSAMIDTLTVNRDNMRKAAARRLHQRHGLRRLPGQEGHALPGGLRHRRQAGGPLRRYRPLPGDAALGGIQEGLGILRGGRVRCPVPGDLRQRSEGLRRPRPGGREGPDRKHQTLHPGACMTMKPVIFIDGREGTTGLQIYDRLTPRQDIELLLIDEEKRKDPAERKKCLNAADLVFLCLPDDAAREAVAMIENPNTKVIDASTAHRTAEGWAYGFPELSPKHREAIIHSKRVANPGCHASGFISSVYPLVQLGLIPPDHPLCAYSLTGYSGGGKKLIAEYQDPNRDPRHESARIYGTTLHHKHLPEMVHVCGLDAPPVFHPILGDYIQGMATTVMLRNDTLPGGPTAYNIYNVLDAYYEGQTFVSVAPFGGDESVIYSDTLVGTNQLRLIVCGHEDQTTITALFDNLGKGASGAAVQNMNLMLGFDEDAGL